MEHQHNETIPADTLNSDLLIKQVGNLFRDSFHQNSPFPAPFIYFIGMFKIFQEVLIQFSGYPFIKNDNVDLIILPGTSLLLAGNPNPTGK